MITGYRHHIFVSYSRSGDVPDWLRNHFLPVLTNRLEAVLDEEPRIYFDGQIDVGTDWPEALAEALNHSCFLLAVWTPSYFRSKWCVAEWETMLNREEELGLKTAGSTGLVYPVVYSDGIYFPEPAQRTTQKTDLRDYAYPYPQFKNSDKYLVFHDKVSEIANDLQKWVTEVPKWSTDWEPVRPDSTAPYVPKFRRL